MSRRERRQAPVGGLGRRALVEFVLCALLSATAVSVATLLVAQTMSERIAIRDAQARGEAFTNGVAAPLVTMGVRDGDPEAIADFDRVMQNRLTAGAIVHMKLWATDGTVLWSDETGLIGHTYELEESVRRQAGTSFAHAELSSLDEPENELENELDPDTGQLLEVYVGTRDADGRPMIFETYWSADRIHSDERRVFWTLAPLSLGSMGLLLLLLLPLAFNLARNTSQHVRERNRVLKHALVAVDLERARIAQLLHDGVIQDLAGVGYALPSAASRLEHEPGLADAREIIDHATDLVRRDLVALRTLLVDIYPPSLGRGELATAIEELAATAERSGLEVTVAVHTDRPLDETSNRLAYRIVREGLLNVVKHAAATRASVDVWASGTTVEVAVRDDGPAPAAVTVTDPRSGHLGLRLLIDAVADHGGELTIGPAVDGGTLLRGSFPVQEQR
ncbi:signal transduction histidine kinase [Nocardioides aromaticivorans]|uniref:Signal transduction histidine kinase n=1 Tax=Nocardioides aromaticivorans TaxID=200618 RepID=A0A7Y9ZJD1_9ACTN|nr:histidine kinase [Nocardioides aromaticivorans]NYI46599.1 signal transduction histidine kinase [Nocardioides aromaticivorans]